MKVRNMVRGGAIVAASLGLASLGTGMGLTNSSSTLSTSPIVASSPMTIVGFDAAVAKEHGFRIVTMPDGHQAAVADTVVGNAQVSPDGEVGGDCGISYVTIASGAPGSFSLLTGFHLDTAATDYEWHVQVDETDLNYEHDFSWGGPLAFRTRWYGRDSAVNVPSGDYLAVVSDTSSLAILWDGGVCYSGGPESSTQVG
ncbi:hypothetical protein [Ferrimicrobium sp.]|nr:hypothetical protein [Ferrimicrobium sp.]